MTETERLDYVIGQMAVLEAFCFALVSTHPNRPALREHFAQLAEYPIAKLLPTQASEAMLEGAQGTQAKLAAVLSA